MQVRNLKNRSVQQHDFAMNPRGDVPRSQFDLSHGKKKPFNFSDIVPILCEFALPGDTWNCRITVAARTAIPIVPVQDNWHLEFFSFFVPMRLLWVNAYKFWGEQDNPADSTAFTIPQIVSPATGFPVGSLYDYLGLPTVGQIGAGTITINALPLRGYNLIWNQWFRDENIQNSVNISSAGITQPGDGPDNQNLYVLKQRGKRFDYATQGLPWPQKGNTAVSLPLGTRANVLQDSTDVITSSANGLRIRYTAGGNIPANIQLSSGPGGAPSSVAVVGTNAAGAATGSIFLSNLYADLSTATAATINALRTSITLQQYLEQDARGGTRYTEYVYKNFNVRTADARLNRPEFIGGGYAPILTTAIPQTSATGLTGGTTPAGTLVASGYAQGSAGFTYSATEHGYLYTFVVARADLTYQQGLRRMWTVQTRYDFPVPILANLGEQAMLNQEIYCVGTSGGAQDTNVFAYVPRFDEYRWIPSQIDGIYRSTAAGTIDYWHSSQKFTALPTLNSAFITDDSKTVVQRNFAAGAATLGQQVLADFYFDIKAARALPLYGIPGVTRI